MFIASNELFSDNTSDGRPVSLSLPAGTYLVTGKAYITSPAYGACYIAVGDTFYDFAFWDNNASNFLALVIDTITLTDAGRIDIRCGTGFGVTWYANPSVLTAQPIAPAGS